MKLNTHFFRRRSSQALMLGGLAVAIQVACSDAPSNPSTGFTAGTTSTAGTTANTAGTTSNTAGTFSTSGSGGTFSTAGTTDVGGGGTTTTGGTTAGTGGSTAGTATAGTGGTPPVPVAYCMGKTAETLPYLVTSGFKSSGYGPDAAAVAEIQQDGNVTTPPTNYCMTDRVPGAKGDCSMWRYTPAATPTYAFVAWSTKWDPGFTHPPVCVADGATAVIFYARGVKGGEIVSVAAAGANEVQITLSKDWEQYEIPLAGVEYNTFDNGVASGFSWKIDPLPANTPISEFFIDNMYFVKDIPPGPGGAGGAGGAGG